MEDLTRMVADSLARHGFVAALDHRRLEWSRWFRCESSFSLLLVPSAAGLYALGEEVIAPGELPSTSGKRLLAVFQVSETEDLCVALSRLFAPRNPLSARLSSGNCFVRFALVADPEQRQVARESLNRWLASSTEIATSLTPTTVGSATSRTAIEQEGGDGLHKGQDLSSPDGRGGLHESHGLSSTSCHPERSEAQPNVVEGPRVRREDRVPASPFSRCDLGCATAEAVNSRVATTAVSPGRKSGETSERSPRVRSGTTAGWSGDLVFAQDFAQPQEVAPEEPAKGTECAPPPLPAGFAPREGCPKIARHFSGGDEDKLKTRPVGTAEIHGAAEEPR